MSRRIGRSDRGAVAVIVAVSLLVLLMIGAAAVDIGRALYARNQLQIAIDGAMKAAGAAALTLPSSLSSTQVTTESRSIIEQFLKANIQPNPGLLVYDLARDLKVTYTPANPGSPGDAEDSILASLTATVPVSFFKLFFPSIQITAGGRVKRPRPSPVQLVITLDVTTSMNEPFGATTKIAALKSSAKKLVTTLMKGDYVRVGLLPFSWLVRLDTSAGYYDASTMIPNVPWLAFPPDPNITDCFGYTKTNCRKVPGVCYNDGVPYSCLTEKCDSIVCTVPKKRPYYWDGCIFMRPPPFLTTISSPTAPQYYGVVSSAGCASHTPVTDLVTRNPNDKAVPSAAEKLLAAKIDALKTVPVGGTYIPSALIWSWNMLTTDVTSEGNINKDYPLNAGYPPAELAQRAVRRAIVLITDGNNSLYSASGYNGKYWQLYVTQSTSNTPAKQAQFAQQTDNEMKAICANIKAQPAGMPDVSPIQIYVIAVQVDDTAYKKLLRDDCASGTADTKANYFFDTNDPSELQKAFDRIGASFSYNSLKD